MNKRGSLIRSWRRGLVFRAAALVKLDPGAIQVKERSDFSGVLLLHCCLLPDPCCCTEKGGIFARQLLKSAQNLGFLSCSWEPLPSKLLKRSIF
uniref:Uncharacterized protein n=1 Tax=Arundo donax TaxID=35708 RepID=A0A0A9FNY6_ARUDO